MRRLNRRQLIQKLLKSLAFDKDFHAILNDKASIQIIVYQLSQFLFANPEIAGGFLNSEAEFVLYQNAALLGHRSPAFL